MKIKATNRLKVTAAEEPTHEGGYNLSTGANAFRMHSPQEAYRKAAEFIEALERSGWKFNPRGTMSHKMDVFTKGGQEISISVRNSILNIDLW